jgi:hypothetical protein
MLTTIHTDSMIQSGKIDRSTNTQIMKPTSVMEYNKNMGPVDRYDDQLFGMCPQIHEVVQKILFSST